MKQEESNKKAEIKTQIHALRNKLSHIGSYLYNSRLFPKSSEGEELYAMAVSDYKDVTHIIQKINKILEPEKEFNLNIMDDDFILFVEDDKANREQLENRFKSKGFSVLALSKGEELSFVDLDYSKVIMAIVDYRYEGSPVDGFDVIEYLKRNHVKKIHLCTADYDDQDFKTKFARLSGVALLKKPFDQTWIEKFAF